MHIEHINLVVTNLETTLTFYRAAFPYWKVRGQGEQDWYGMKRTWLHFGDENDYLSFADSGTGENRDLQSNQLGLAHFGFITNNLDATIERLQNAGFTIHKPGNPTEFRKNVYFLDPDGYEVEFVEYMSDDPTQRNQYTG
ncbi:VOC family protein [Alteromonas sp. a30]|uniref:VOC family protein n=1 Tax=Alteromonas sp. a30 TaxID=2730917 RepID=UPI00227EE91D|nr:VOC family protein [Alteromonas sp. a30]MCY7294503.1 VOC family protein [Alteromonas sp. a30]